MKCTALTLFLIHLSGATMHAAESDAPQAVLAWFTDARVKNSIRTSQPSDILPRETGTEGKGVILEKPVPMRNILFDRENGLISFWIKPMWNGADGKSHRILRIGDPRTNGMLLEKAESGMLRFVVRSPGKETAARTDVSAWKAAQWHHVAISWMSVNGRPVGLPLWIDKVCVAGPVYGGDAFPDPADKRLWIGDATSDAVMDELILRREFKTESGWGQVATVYRDYFRTAPYTKIDIDLRPMYGPMDTRVVTGCEKQFGLLAERSRRRERITDCAVRYCQWSYFDAKPFISWTTSDKDIATVNSEGRVTGKAVGTCTLTAEYRGLKTSFQLEVITADQPDLDLAYVERLPKYKVGGKKDRPSAGETVQSVAHIFNFGYETVPPGVEIVFQLIPDRNRNFRCDPGEAPIHVQRKTIDAELKPQEKAAVSFEWKWTEEPTWIRVVADPENKLPELCEANNQQCDLNLARPLQMGVTQKALTACYNERKINHVGSFSLYDWINGQVARFNAMFRDAVYPTTSPDGVRDSFRIDEIYVMQPDKRKRNDEPYWREENLYDGGFPINEGIDLMAIDAAILHEFGHTCAALPDLYGYGVFKDNVLLRDSGGTLYVESPLLPAIQKDGLLPLSSANSVPCGVGYRYLMDGCQLQLAPFHAGAVQWFAGYRGNRFWGTQGRTIPFFEHCLEITDIDDKPLKGAAIYVYEVINTPCRSAATKYFTDRPKFTGNTDDAGLFRFPGRTDPHWDDPETDEVEGSIQVWNPFGRARSRTGDLRDTAFTPNVWTVEGLLLVKVAGGAETELHFLSLTDFNTAFFSGSRQKCILTIRTSMHPAGRITGIARPPIPEAVKKINLKPMAVAPREITVKCGSVFSIDGSKSRDPEGQPLTFRWRRTEGWGDPVASTEPVLKGRATAKPGITKYQFYVIDGLRASDPVVTTVKAVK